jgi:enterochelin esterase family protein
MGNNPSYVRFVAEEAIPWVQQHYRVTRDPRRIVIGGSSLGGLAASHVALRYPRVVGNVLSQSGSYQWASPADSQPEWLTRQFAASPKAPIRFYLEAGRFEVGAPLGGVGLIDANRRFRDVVRAKGYELTYREVDGGHEYLSWRGSIRGALTLFFEHRR